MTKAEVQRFIDGYIVAVTDANDLTWYLTKNYKGKYVYMLDSVYAKRFRDKKTALKHAKRIEENGK